MNIQRFTAPTSREALAKARLAFGEGTLILSNRPTTTGIEVVATAEDALAALDPSDLVASKVGAAISPARPRTTPTKARQNNAVEDDAVQLAMSTLSFQDYVRERMLKRRHEVRPGTASEDFQAGPQPASTSAAGRSKKPVSHSLTGSSKVEGVAGQYDQDDSHLSPGITREFHAMRELIEDRFNTLTWLGQARQDPMQSNLMLKLIRAGYSPNLARTLLERMPPQASAHDAVQWVMDMLERNLKTDATQVPLHEEGGIFALVGATGVGKTTTAAKLAGICAQNHGAHSVGLITLDTYRVGAHEQLRTYGRMLGVVAHLAHDKAALQDLLNLFVGKKMVLIDTTGLAPRDPRKSDMLDLLELPQIKRLQVLNACSHGDTLDDMVASFKFKGAPQAILTKTDEAVKLGPALDVLIRHQLVLRGTTHGQRVPEDWYNADAGKLVRLSMRASSQSAFEPKTEDLGFFFAAPTPVASPTQQAHA